MLPDNVWAARAIVLAILVVFLFILINLVTCIAGAVSGPHDETTDTSTTPANETQGSENQAGQQETQQEQATMPGKGSSTGVDDPWVQSGKFTTGDSELDEFVKELCDSNSTSSDPSANAFNTYKAILAFDYKERDDNQYVYNSTWDVDFAVQFMQEKNGNCFNNAAMSQWVCRYFGYDDARALPIVVLMQSGEWSDHGAVFVTDVYHDNKQCVIDDALFEDGWMMNGDSYTYSIIDVGQTIDPNFFATKFAEGVVDPPEFWYKSKSSTSAEADEAADDESDEDESAGDEDGESNENEPMEGESEEPDEESQ